MLHTPVFETLFLIALLQKSYIWFPVTQVKKNTHPNKGFIVINRPDSIRNYVTIMIIKTYLNFLGQNYTESF